jgi:hypothetical protein
MNVVKLYFLLLLSLVIYGRVLAKNLPYQEV